ncbi:phosphate/phosphite/phosphonate ABC transporter substrate-binding protein [Motiliproteus coralliicola]|uniref:phosphate/phosphite/phosphonate ABC transporter substrate-binding protein n=1 Tax=Motiliproteus coralliicola TaxID=2283196 RepID=UPI00140236B6|nr:PhnD/SsuA/transferrin family substrate-binding protein [Motiliproteus coralliicola]
MNLIASLPWYDLPASQNALDLFWHRLRAELERQSVSGLPQQLNRELTPQQLWQRPELLLSQCCGPDLFTEQAAGLEPIARPVFRDLACTPGSYFSHIVTTRSAPVIKHPRLVVNAPSSRSGCLALLEWLDEQGIDVEAEPPLISGSHQQSLQYLREGRADLAAIDAHSWGLLDHHDLTVIGRSREAEAPPFVRHRHNPIPTAVLYAALEKTVQVLGSSIGISELIETDIEVYRGMEGDSSCLSACAHTGPAEQSQLRTVA